MIVTVRVNTTLINTIKNNMDEKRINGLITSFVGEYFKYREKNWIHIILSDKKNWVIAYADSGYTFYNNDLFCNLFKYISIPHSKQEDYIKSWVKDVFGVNVKNHFYPDKKSGDYNWSDEFIVSDILKKGELVT
jgi:hypothetical protein